MTCVWRERRGDRPGWGRRVRESMAHGLLTELQRESKLPPQPPSHCGLVALDTGMQGASCWHGPTVWHPALPLPAPELPLGCGVCVEAQGLPCASCSGLSPRCTASEDSGLASSHWGFSGPWAVLVSPWAMGWAMGEELGRCVCLEVSFLGRFLAARQAPHALHCAHRALSSLFRSLPEGGQGLPSGCECECRVERGLVGGRVCLWSWPHRWPSEGRTVA